MTAPDPATGATGLLQVFHAAEVLEFADVHIAQRICALGGEPDERVALAVAVAVRVLRGGSWAVAPEILRPSFRNWDHPYRRQIFAGVRLAWDA
ncbi:Hercynine oxygenase [Mycobacterium talmoniae]|uniref:Hercynine oxygenase n=1 Tax=Mycobacterium talmoniae TaxID=1858794 RepID=A0A2S8BS24_9MYCO|nr:Hercynine oxygenase [Mycobacterium talmoniae]